MKYILLVLFLFIELFPQGNMTFNRKHYWTGIRSAVTDTSTNIYVDGNNGSDSNDGLTSATAKLTFSAGIALVNASTDTIFVTGTFDNPFAITKTCGLSLTAVFYSQLLDDYTFVPGDEGGSIVDTFYVGSGTDDKVRVSSTALWDFDYLSMGAEYSNMKVATRFVNVTERAGYDSAKIEYTAYSSATDDTVKLRFYGEDDGSVATYPSNYADFDDRYAIKTTAYHDTNFTDNWVDGTNYKFRITNVISELFTSYAYTGSQAISIFNVNNASTTNAFRYASAYDYLSGSEKAKLIVYSSGTASNAYYWKSEPDSVMYVYFGSELGTENSDKSLLDSTKEWCYNGDTLYIYGEVLPPSGTADKYVCAACTDVDAVDDSATTIAEVNAWTLVAGDTVAFKITETFDDAILVPQNNVVYTSYNGDGRYILQPSSLSYQGVTVDASGVSGATIENAEIIGRFWINATGSSNLTFDNIYCHHYQNTDGYMQTDSRGLVNGQYSGNLYLTVKNSIFISGFSTLASTDMFNFVNSSYIYFENNYLRDVPHALLMLQNAHHVASIGNRYYNTFHHAADSYQSNAHDLIFQYNLFEKSGSGERGSQNDVEYNGEIGLPYQGSTYNSIFRYNVIKRGGVGRNKWNNPGMLSFSPPFYNNRVYNNVIDSSYNTFGLRMTFSDGDQYLYGNTLFNNAITRTGDNSWDTYYGTITDSAQFITWDESSAYSPSGNVLEYNYFGGDGNNLYNYTGGNLYTTNTTSISGFTFQNNIDSYYAYSVFDAPDDSVTNYIYWTPQTSRGNLYDSVLAKYNGKTPLIDAGRPHTYINGTVNNDTILVDDARVFFDGWNWLEGDSLKIDTFRVQVIGINYTTNYIALSGIVNVLDNTPVYLINPYTHDAYKETAIDIGLE